MAGCGGNCSCKAEEKGTCGQRSEGPREPARLADALAKVIIDNRIVKFTMNYIKDYPLASVDEIIIAANMAKERGELV